MDYFRFIEYTDENNIKYYIPLTEDELKVVSEALLRVDKEYMLSCNIYTEYKVDEILRTSSNAFKCKGVYIEEVKKANSDYDPFLNGSCWEKQND